MLIRSLDLPKKQTLCVSHVHNEFIKVTILIAQITFKTVVLTNTLLNIMRKNYEFPDLFAHLL